MYLSLRRTNYKVPLPVSTEVVGLKELLTSHFSAVIIRLPGDLGKPTFPLCSKSSLHSRAVLMSNYVHSPGFGEMGPGGVRICDLSRRPRVVHHTSLTGRGTRPRLLILIFSTHHPFLHGSLQCCQKHLR